VLGFGVTCYLLFLIPLAAVVAMPSAVAGATLLARRLVGEESGERQRSDGLRRGLPHPT
jgi:CysZ protein